MTNQDNLPIWARIILGVPIRDDSQTDNAAADGPKNVGSAEHDDGAQSVLAFDPIAGKRKRGWYALMCPAPRESRS